jgi:NADP-dependent 3-hydroxy acid dehydrogenase YdfG
MAQRLTGKVAWVTGAGTGIGEAAALALADEGATVVLTGRRVEPLERLAARIHQSGGVAHVHPGDLMNAATPQRIGKLIMDTLGRLDILVNNAGLNIRDRHWADLTPEGIDTLVHGNLSAALYCVTVVLPIMRAQQDGLIIHTASMAGRFIGGLSGPIYTASKHGVVAMSHTINMEECHNGIRSTAMLPGEVATPILDQRPIPVTPAERARLVQPEDCGDLVRYIACLPAHICINEVMITPAYNRGYIAARARV